MKFYLYFHSTTVLKKALTMPNTEIISLIASNKKRFSIESIFHGNINNINVVLKHYGYQLIPDDVNNKND